MLSPRVHNTVGNKAKSQDKGNKKTKYAKFSEKQIFLNPWYAHAYVNITDIGVVNIDRQPAETFDWYWLISIKTNEILGKSLQIYNLQFQFMYAYQGVNVFFFFGKFDIF